MDDAVRMKMDKFENIYSILSKEYKWSSSQMINIFTSLIYTSSNVDFNKTKMDDILKFIKENTGTFSHHRGHDRFFISALLNTNFEAPMEAFKKLSMLEEQLKEGGFSRGTYSGFSAYLLLTSSQEGTTQFNIRKAKLIYDRIREKHFWLTGQDDYPLSVLLSFSEEDVDTIVNRIETLFDMLHRSGFSKSNSLQFLSHILSFGEGPVELKVQKCHSIVDYFKEKKIRINSTHYGTIGLIALIYDNKNEILDDIMEIIEHLKGQKNFKWTGRDVLLLIASALVMNKHVENYKEHSELLKTTLGISVQAIIAAQTAAMVASITAVSAAASAASSSS